MNHLPRAAAAYLGLIAIANAQAPEPIAASPLTGLPNGISAGSLTYGPTGALLDTTVVLWKDPGFSMVAPAIPTVVAGRPDFSPAAMFPGLAVRPELDGMSIGLDWIWADAGGRVVIPPPPNWAALTFSISRGSVGAVGSTIAQEVVRPDGAAADLFSYFFPAPVLPPTLRDKTLLMQDSREMRLWDGVHKGNIDAHDLFMTLYDLDPALAALLPANPWFYFTVSSASIGAVPLAWWAGTTPSGASILRMQWIGGVWTVPKVWIRYDQLGLVAENDVDALAVDEAHGMMLFSTNQVAPDEIMFANLNADAIATAVYRYPGTPEVPVSVKVGVVAGDDIDAICALDPGGLNPLLRDALVARPLVTSFPNFGGVHGSTFRRQISHTGQAQLESWLTGYPGGLVQPGFAACFLQGVNPQTPPIQVFQTSRQPSPLFGGAPTRFQVNLPPSSVLLGIDIDSFWAAANASFTNWDVTLPARLRI